MGIGKAAVYKHIPEYFPHDVGAVGGLVGMLGALGGFLLPPLFVAVDQLDRPSAGHLHGAVRPHRGLRHLDARHRRADAPPRQP